MLKNPEVLRYLENRNRTMRFRKVNNKYLHPQLRTIHPPVWNNFIDIACIFKINNSIKANNDPLFTGKYWVHSSYDELLFPAI